MKNLLFIFFIITRISISAQPNICLQLTQDTIPGYSPNIMATGDMNNDGFVDLIDRRPAPSRINIYLSDGAGNFTSNIILPQTYFPHHLKVAELNQDPNLDLLITKWDTIALMLGTGAGSFTAGKKIKISSFPSAIEVADFNGDQLMDFVITCQSASLVSVFLGSGNGNFYLPVSFTLPSEPQHAIVRDFNNDGKKDIFIAATTFNYFLKGGGNGTFTTIAGPPPSNTPGPYTFAHVNNDNLLDLILISTDSIRVKLATGNFGFGNTTCSYVQGYSQILDSGAFTIADLNNDGKNDLAVGTHGFSLSVLYGNGVSSFSAQQTYTSPVTVPITNILAVDLTNDMKQDLIIFQVFMGVPHGNYGVYVNCNTVDVGATEIKKDLISYSLFPNPAKNHFLLKGPEEVEGTEKFNIYDQFARKIKQIELSFYRGVAEIRTEDLPNGIYLLKSQDPLLENKAMRFIIAK